MSVTDKAPAKRRPKAKRAPKKTAPEAKAESPESGKLPAGDGFESRVERLRKHPACGIWADREDMKDPDEWLRKMRRPRFKDIFGGGGGDGK